MQQAHHANKVASTTKGVQNNANFNLMNSYGGAGPNQLPGQMAQSTVQGNGSQGGIQFPNGRPGYENTEMSSKFKKKNGRMVSENIGQQNQLQNSFNGTNSKGFSNQQMINSQNRKLTPNKMNVGIKANSSMGQNTSNNMARNFENVKK